MATIEISKDFGWVLAVAVSIGLQVVIQGFVYAGGARRQVFNADYYRQPNVKTLVEAHKKATKSDKLPPGGYPDMGSGRYSQELPYEDWYKFACAQRAHYNYVEGIATILIVLLTAGLFFPRFAAIAGVVYIIGRHFYASGYAANGPNGRGIGAGLLDIALFSLAGAALYGSLQLAGAWPLAQHYAATYAGVQLKWPF